MGYRTLRACLDDLEATGQLVRIEEEIDPHLEAAEIQRRVFAAGGPALLLCPGARVARFRWSATCSARWSGCGTSFATRWTAVRRLVELQGRPAAAWSPTVAAPGTAAGTLWHMLPRVVCDGPVLAHETTIDQLAASCNRGPTTAARSSRCRRSTPKTPTGPAGGIRTWACIACSSPADSIEPNREVGLHYQIHRGIGVHHAAAIRRGEPLRVNVFVGGAPAMSVAAVMPLPEGMSRTGLRRRAGRASHSA